MSESDPIAPIRAIHTTLTPSGSAGGWREAYRQDVGVLLAEVDRLRARLTAANDGASILLTQMDSLIADVRKFGVKENA